MQAKVIAREVLLISTSMLLLAISATCAWAVVSDYQSRDVVSKGVTVAGRDLTGMDEAQARTAIDEAVAPMMRPMTVTGEDRSLVLDPKGILAVDVDSMVDQAYEPRRKATLVVRVTSRLAGLPLPADVKPVSSVDASAVAQWVKETASLVNHKPVDAARTARKYAIRIKPAVYGAKVREASATVRLSQALTSDEALTSPSRVVTLPITRTRPKVLQSSFKSAIVVSLSRCRIRLYRGSKLVKTYRCAPGQPAWPTPRGDFVVVSKLANSPWYNPHSAWSASMPDVIPGGPYNPMGDRKIGISYPGVFMHGVPPSEYSSIGTHASHGCMRMMPSDVHDLFGRVRIGDPVFIRD